MKKRKKLIIILIAEGVAYVLFRLFVVPAIPSTGMVPEEAPLIILVVGELIIFVIYIWYLISENR